MHSGQFIFYDESKDKSRFYHLLKQLRTDLSLAEFEQVYSEARKSNSYQIVGMEIGGELVALMGFRILTDFLHGKHLYIDDLVSSELHRSKGYGAQMLDYAIFLAKDLGCSNLRLSTGIKNDKGKQFYEKNGWSFKAVVYKRKI